MEVKRVTVFPREGKGGNKAAVVLKCEGLGDHHMQEIAGEIGYSETVFLTRLSKSIKSSSCPFGRVLHDQE